MLRVLGRNSTFDCIAELTNSNQEVHRLFFHKFNDCFVKKFYSTYVYAPTTLDDITKVAKIYDKLGLPGCVGSIDCVHIAWERCPQIHKNWYTGKG